MTQSARTHRRTRRIYWVGSMPGTNAHGQRRGDPERRLAAAVLLRAVADLEWLKQARLRLRGKRREAVDAEARDIIGWLTSEDCWANVLAEVEETACRHILATMPADWRAGDEPADLAGTASRAGSLPGIPAAGLPA